MGRDRAPSRGRHAGTVAALFVVLALAIPSAAAAGTVSVKAGTGSGASQTGAPVAGGVVSTPAGIDCGESCSAEFGPGSVLLTYDPPDPGEFSGVSFAGWSGCDDEPTVESCEVAVTEDGSHEVVVEFSDSESPSVEFPVEDGAVVDGSWIGGGVFLQANASDNWWVEKVRFDFTGPVAVPSRESLTPFGGSYFAGFDSSLYPDGEYGISASALDPDGNADASDPIAVTFDNTLPVVAVDGPNDQTLPAGASPTWEIAASDPENGTVGNAIVTVICSVVPRGASPAYDDCSGGFAGGSGSHRADGLVAGEYTFAVLVSDRAGNFVIEERDFAIAAPVPPPAPPPPPSPPPPEPPPPSHLRVQLLDNWVITRRWTRVAALVLRRVPRQARIVVRCKGRGCAFKQRRVSTRRPRVNLARLFKGRKLRPRTVIVVRVAMRGRIGRLYRFATRRRKPPRSITRCLVPGKRKPVRCSARSLRKR